MVLGMEPRTLHVLDKHSTTEAHHQPTKYSIDKEILSNGHKGQLQDNPWDGGKRLEELLFLFEVYLKTRNKSAY
jgi:hypothetical protein